jgi:hypothetical protein
MSKKAKRSPNEVKEIEIGKLKRAYEETNRTQCPQKVIRDLERKYETQILPRVYESEK